MTLLTCAGDQTWQLKYGTFIAFLCLSILFHIWWGSGLQIAEGHDDTLAHGHSRTNCGRWTHSWLPSHSVTLRVCDWQNFQRFRPDRFRAKQVASFFDGGSCRVQGWAKGLHRLTVLWWFIQQSYMFVLHFTEKHRRQTHSHASNTGQVMAMGPEAIFRYGAAVWDRWHPMALFVRWVRSALICDTVWYSIIFIHQASTTVLPLRNSSYRYFPCCAPRAVFIPDIPSISRSGQRHASCSADLTSAAICVRTPRYFAKARTCDRSP